MRLRSGKTVRANKDEDKTKMKQTNKTNPSKPDSCFVEYERGKTQN